MKHTKGKRIRAAAGLVAASFILTACGSSFPELTDQQYNQTVEYAVGLLMKYSANKVKKLTYLDPTVELSKEEDPFASAGTGASGETLVAGLEGSRDASSDAASSGSSVGASTGGSADTGNSAVSGTGASSGEGMSAATGASADAGSASESSGSVQAAEGEEQDLGSGITIAYDGYDLYDYYPQGGSANVISAKLGNSLVVLKFKIRNSADSDQSVDLISDEPKFRAVINGKDQGFYAPTMLDNDLTLLKTSLSPGDEMEEVLVVEVPQEEAENIESVGLNVKYSGKTQTVTFS